MSAKQLVHLNDPFPYKDYRYDQDRAGYQQTDLMRGTTGSSLQITFIINHLH